MNELLDIIIDSNGPFGLNTTLVLNLISQGLWALFAIALTTIFVERYIRYRARRRWKKVRQSFARRLNYPHRAILDHYEVLSEANANQALERFDSDRFRNNLTVLRTQVEAHISSFGYAIDAHTADAVEEYRQTFSYLVGIGRYLGQGDPATVRWRAPSKTPKAIFAHAHDCLMRVYNVCDLRSELPSSDKKLLSDRAHKLDLDFRHLVSIETRPAGYLRDKSTTLDPQSLMLEPEEEN